MCHNVSDGRVLDYFVHMQHKKKGGGGGVGMKGGKYQFKGVLADSDSDHEPLVSAMPPTPAPVTAAKLKVSECVCVHVHVEWERKSYRQQFTNQNLSELFRIKLLFYAGVSCFIKKTFT